MIHKKTVCFELLSWFLSLGLLLFILFDFVSGKTVAAGDTLNFYFPYYHYFATSLINGEYPLWDPYTHAGQPMYLLHSHHQFLDPFVLIEIWIGKHFTHDTVALFNTTLLVQALIQLFGVYLLLRTYTTRLFTRILLVPVLLFSTFLFVSFRQYGPQFIFAWVPYLVYCLNQIFFKKDGRVRWWVLSGLCVGLNWQSYYFVGTWTFLFFYGMGLFLFYRKNLKAVFAEKGIRIKVFLFTLILLIMVTPLLSLIWGSKGYVFPARLGLDEYLKAGVADVKQLSGLSYGFIRATGNYYTLWNFIHLLVVPWGSMGLADASESMSAFGGIVWILSLIGIFLGKQEAKRLWLLLFVTFAFLLLGPIGGLHPILYYLLPILRFFRNTAQFSGIFQTAVLYFFIIGLESVLEKRDQRKTFEFKIISSQILIVILSTVLLMGVGFSLIQLTKQAPYFQALLLWLVTISFWVSRKALPGVYWILIVLLTQTSLAAYFSNWNVGALAIALLCLLPFFTPLNMRANSFHVTLLLVLICQLAYNLRNYRGYFSHDRKMSLQIDLPEAIPFKFPRTRVVSPYSQSTPLSASISSPQLFSRETSVFSNLGIHRLSWKDDLKKGRLPFLVSKNYLRLWAKRLPEEEYKSIFKVGEPLISFYPVSMSTYFLKEYSPNHLTLATTTPAPSRLYYADGFDPNWKAYIDGKEEKIERTNENFKSLLVPGGTHHVEFRYRPMLFIWSLGLFYGTLLLSLGGIFFFDLKKSKIAVA